MTATEKHQMVLNHLKAGRAVFFCTALRITKITPKYLAMIDEIVKVKGDSIYLRRGKAWDCADYCAIKA